jgi:threonylcarbamoyladenosine tRNA methylthiotransferase MtaB
MKIKIITLGCKVNMYESEYIKEAFIKSGGKIVAENADVVVINTCSVTNQADAKSRKMIRRSKNENKDAIIVVCGCMSENHQTDLKALGIDILIGSKEKSNIVNLVKEYQLKKQKINKFYDLNNIPFEDMFITSFSDKTRAFVKIEDGCNNYCTYCTIPYVRGKERSKDFDKVIKEVNILVKNGYQEIVLTGIHTGNYKDEDKRLVDVIHEIAKIRNLARIRISSIEITEIDDKFLAELKNNPKICNHLHIPLQSGTDNTLKVMHRKYTTKKYLEIINKIRKVRKDINLTTDVIVGFPTETAKDFDDTLKFIKKVGFSKVHVFPYSKRDNTVAAKLSNIVSDEEKKLRSKKLIELSEELELAYMKKFINKKLPVLIEKSGAISNGHTSNYLNVFINKKLIKNQIYEVTITNIIDNKIYGEIN